MIARGWCHATQLHYLGGRAAEKCWGTLCWRSGVLRLCRSWDEPRGNNPQVLGVLLGSPRCRCCWEVGFQGEPTRRLVPWCSEEGCCSALKEREDAREGLVLELGLEWGDEGGISSLEVGNMAPFASPADCLHSVPVAQMGNYQEYLKMMPSPLREIDPDQPKRLHTFGNPFKQDKKVGRARPIAAFPCDRPKPLCGVSPVVSGTASPGAELGLHQTDRWQLSPLQGMMIDEADEFVAGPQNKIKRPGEPNTPASLKRRRSMSPLLRWPQSPPAVANHIGGKGPPSAPGSPSSPKATPAFKGIWPCSLDAVLPLLRVFLVSFSHFLYCCHVRCVYLQQEASANPSHSSVYLSAVCLSVTCTCDLLKNRHEKCWIVIGGVDLAAV